MTVRRSRWYCRAVQRVHESSGGKDCNVEVSSRGKHRGEGSVRAEDMAANSDLNLGVLLLEFFQVYGHRLNFERVGITLRHGGGYFRKADRWASAARWFITPTLSADCPCAPLVDCGDRGWSDYTRPWLLSIENPLDPDMDVGKNSFNMQRIQQTFAHALASILHRLNQVGAQCESFEANSSVDTWLLKPLHPPLCVSSDVLAVYQGCDFQTTRHRYTLLAYWPVPCCAWLTICVAHVGCTMLAFSGYRPALHPLFRHPCGPHAHAAVS
jgi:hypothetical protein